MKMPVLLLAMLCPTAHAFGTATDTWRGADKLKHAQYSCAFGLAASYVRPESKWEAFGLAMIPGLLKELNDVRIKDGSGFSVKDMAANAVGAGACVQVGNWAANYKPGAVTVSYARSF